MLDFSKSLRRAIIAIPARDEAERLAGCIRALVGQTDAAGLPLSGQAFGVLVFANNCSDDSARIARAAARGAPFETRVVEARLPPEVSHAGGARRAAMESAAAWLGETSPGGVILTTDADSMVAADWVSANLDAISLGADAVLGQISLDEEGERLPAALHARGRLEGVYEELLTEISARLDPQIGNPWPHHSTISGASLAVTADVYRRVGGLPCVPLGEDKALVATLRRIDARIRYAPEVRAVTSGRTSGRAPGGVADTLRLRSADPGALCDEALERCAVAYRRALWRGRLRRGGLASVGWRQALRVPAAAAARARAATTFGEAWEKIERASPGLARRGLPPAELPGQIEAARRLLQRLEEKLAAREDVEAVLGTPLAADDFDLIL
jgi:cellulose synthase/poly-beta-1,6-N-acetylglucosamine synthase-like glycosyltransferase